MTVLGQGVEIAVEMIRMDLDSSSNDALSQGNLCLSRQRTGRHHDLRLAAAQIFFPMQLMRIMIRTEAMPMRHVTQWHIQC